MYFTVTAKVRLKPTPKEAALLLETMHAYRDGCNFVAEYIMQHKTLAVTALNKALYYELRERFGLKAQMAQSVIRTVIARYKAILATEKKWLQPDFKKPALDLLWNRDYSFKKDRASVNSLNGRLKMPFFNNGLQQYFDGTWRFGTAKLVLKHGKWYLHIPVSKEIEELSHTKVANVVGVDFGINFITASYGSNGKTAFYSGKVVKHKRAHYKKARQQMQKRQTASARRRLKQIGGRENRWINDVNHCASKALVKNNPEGSLFVIEDLAGIRAATERVRLEDRYVTVSWAFYDLRQKLEYKALMKNSAVLVVSPKYTSQTCPKCGHREPANRDKKKHVFTCKTCGYQSNDDRIGAMNLYRKGIEYLCTVGGE